MWRCWVESLESAQASRLWSARVAARDGDDANLYDFTEILWRKSGIEPGSLGSDTVFHSIAGYGTGSIFRADS